MMGLQGQRDCSVSPGIDRHCGFHATRNKYEIPGSLFSSGKIIHTPMTSTRQVCVSRRRWRSQIPVCWSAAMQDGNLSLMDGAEIFLLIAPVIASVVALFILRFTVSRYFDPDFMTTPAPTASIASHNDPAPRPPVEPALEDCCQSGCDPCIFTIYQDALERYQENLLAWQARQDAVATSGVRKNAPKNVPDKV